MKSVWEDNKSCSKSTLKYIIILVNKHWFTRFEYGECSIKTARCLDKINLYTNENKVGVRENSYYKNFEGKIVDRS